MDENKNKIYSSSSYGWEFTRDQFKELFLNTLDKTTIFVNRIEEILFEGEIAIMKYRINYDMKRLFVTAIHRFEFKCPDIQIVQAFIMQESGKAREGLEERVKENVVRVVKKMKNKRLCILVYDVRKLIDLGIKAMGDEIDGIYKIYKDYEPDLTDSSSPFISNLQLPTRDNSESEESEEEESQHSDDIEDLDNKIKAISSETDVKNFFLIFLIFH